jgi:hypothetical protein
MSRTTLVVNLLQVVCDSKLLLFLPSRLQKHVNSSSRSRALSFFDLDIFVGLASLDFPAPLNQHPVCHGLIQHLTYDNSLGRTLSGP